MGAAAVTAFVADPLLAPAGAALAFGATYSERTRVAVHAVAIAACAACAAGTIALQLRHDYPPGFGWASNFDRLHPVGWLVFVAMGVLVADVRRPAAEDP